MKRGRERGWFTVNELNEVLPRDRRTAEEIEEVLHRLSVLGINVVESDPTLEELGKQLEKTRQRIRQIEAKVLRKPQSPQDD